MVTQSQFRLYVLFDPYRLVLATLYAVYLAVLKERKICCLGFCDLFLQCMIRATSAH